MAARALQKHLRGLPVSNQQHLGLNLHLATNCSSSRFISQLIMSPFMQAMAAPLWLCARLGRDALPISGKMQ